MKAVLHIGMESDVYSHLGLERGFRQAGFTEYNFMNWQAVRMNAGVQGCQARMIVAAKNLQPDIIFMHLQNPEILDDETLTELSKIAFTINYCFDVRDADNTEWYFQLAPFFGLTLFACKEDADEARRRGIHNVGNIHSSCDTEVYHPMQLSDEQKKKYPEIVFIGNNYERTNHQFEKSKEREEMVKFMKGEFGDRFRVFGMNWEHESRIINPQEENLIYNSAKIVICHNNFFRDGYCSDRQWRSMSSGSATIMQYYPGIDEDFKWYKGALVYWKTFDDIRWNTLSLLNNENWLLETKAAGRSELVANHTWEHRIRQIKFMIHAITGKQSAAV